MSVEPSRFQIQTYADVATTTLALSGELDMLVAPELEETVRRACDAGAAELVLDLSAITFMDSAGLRSTLTARNICQRSGRSFAIIPGPRQVQSLFEMTGLLTHLPFRAATQPLTVHHEGILPRLFAPIDHVEDPQADD